MSVQYLKVLPLFAKRIIKIKKGNKGTRVNTEQELTSLACTFEYNLLISTKYTTYALTSLAFLQLLAKRQLLIQA